MNLIEAIAARFRKEKSVETINGESTAAMIERMKAQQPPPAPPTPTFEETLAVDRDWIAETIERSGLNEASTAVFGGRVLLPEDQDLSVPLSEAGKADRRAFDTSVIDPSNPSHFPPDAMDDQRLRRMLRLHEGSRLKPYVDTVGKVTIGVGHNLTDNGITKAIEAAMLEEDIAVTMADLRRGLSWFDELDGVRQAVLIDMCFNMGWPVFSKFVNTLAAVRDGRYQQAKDQMLVSKWAGQVGSRALRLAEMMRSGQWPNV